MIHVHFPNNNIPEREYVIAYMLDLLGLEYAFFPEKKIENYEFRIDGELKLIFEDHFFKLHPLPGSYLKKQNLPKESFSGTYKDMVFECIFGDERIDTTSIPYRISLDIFGASFFMLSRWEEHVIQEKDEHGRCPDEVQLSVRMGFHQRAVVNEYISLLAVLLNEVGIPNRLKRNFSRIWTSDLEFTQKYRNYYDVLRSSMGSILKRADFKEALLNFKEGSLAMSNKDADPYRKGLLFLVNKLNEKGKKLQLYLIPSKKHEFDARYDVEDLPDYLNTLEVELGIHPSYLSFQNPEQLKLEIERLAAIGIEARQGRQHFFRFDASQTWASWDELGLKCDSTIGFIERAGFRAGICYPYPCFDILNSKKLDLIEMPCIIMDVALLKELKAKSKHFELKWNEIEREVVKFKGDLCILWHPNNVNHGAFRSIFPFLEQKLNKGDEF